MTAADLFHHLTAPAAASDESVYAVAEITSGIWVGKSPACQAALLVRSEPTARPPLVTRHLRADFGATCQLRHGDSISSLDETATIIECTSTDPSVVAHFLVAVSACLAAEDGTAPTDVRVVLHALVEVFRAMSRPAITSVQGVWGELFVIANSNDPALLVDAWRATAQDRHDFGMSTQRVEVKTTTARRRQHRFAHGQLATSNEEDLLVVSLQLESAANGATTSDLLSDAIDRLGTDARRRARLLTGVAEALGEDWQVAEGQRYDLAAARRSVQYYDRAVIPTIPSDLPDAIFDVHYSIDLTTVPILSSAELSARAGIHRAVMQGPKPHVRT